MNEFNQNTQDSEYTYYENDELKQETEVQAEKTQPAQKRKKRRRKKIYFRPTKEGMTALGILVLIVAVAITLLVLGIKGIAKAVTGAEETTTSEITTAETTTEPPIVAKWYDDYIEEIIPSSDVSEGDLILVNFENPYSNTDEIVPGLKSLYGSDGHNTLFVLNNSSIKIRRNAVTPLKNMLADLVDENPDTLDENNRVIISSGHRTTEYQAMLYNNSIEENYVAEPGCSEHHTGYAVDLKIFDENYKTIPMRDNEQEWMEANCANYGFILRYDGTKSDITGILDETWHYRYVGIPHATYMMENDLCLEEYIDMLRISHCYEDGEPLEIMVDEQQYLVYYVPASADDATIVPAPPESVGSYEISGNNQDGFIVTVTCE